MAQPHDRERRLNYYVHTAIGHLENDKYPWQDRAVLALWDLKEALKSPEPSAEEKE